MSGSELDTTSDTKVDSNKNTNIEDLLKDLLSQVSQLQKEVKELKNNKQSNDKSSNYIPLHTILKPEDDQDLFLRERHRKNAVDKENVLTDVVSSGMGIPSTSIEYTTKKVGENSSNIFNEIEKYVETPFDKKLSADFSIEESSLKVSINENILKNNKLSSEQSSSNTTLKEEDDEDVYIRKRHRKYTRDTENVSTIPSVYTELETSSTVKKVEDININIANNLEKVLSKVDSISSTSSGYSSEYTTIKEDDINIENYEETDLKDKLSVDLNLEISSKNSINYPHIFSILFSF